jgi:hypothetical protein
MLNQNLLLKWRLNALFRPSDNDPKHQTTLICACKARIINNHVHCSHMRELIQQSSQPLDYSRFVRWTESNILDTPVSQLNRINDTLSKVVKMVYRKYTVKENQTSVLRYVH